MCFFVLVLAPLHVPLVQPWLACQLAVVLTRYVDVLFKSMPRSGVRDCSVVGVRSLLHGDDGETIACNISMGWRQRTKQFIVLSFESSLGGAHAASPTVRSSLLRVASLRHCRCRKWEGRTDGVRIDVLGVQCSDVNNPVDQDGVGTTPRCQSMWSYHTNFDSTSAL